MQPMTYTCYGSAVPPYQHRQINHQQYPHAAHSDQYHQQQYHCHRNDEMLFQMLKGQIEYYFDPQNLVHNPFLQAQLNSAEHLGAVSIDIICCFPKVRELYAFARYGPSASRHQMHMVDPNVVRIALRRSEFVGVSKDGMWIGPVRPSRNNAQPAKAAVIPHHSAVSQDIATLVGTVEDERTTAKDAVPTSATTVTTAVSSVTSTPSSPSSQASSLGVPILPLPSFKERNTVIVRDAPVTATEIEVTEAFSSEYVMPRSVRPDVGNTWYVTFESEEQAMSALANTRDRTIAGAPIFGRLKNAARNSMSEPLLPTMAPLPPPQVVAWTATSINHTASYASVPSFDGSSRSTLTASSYPSGIPMNSQMSQGYGYATPATAHGMPVPPKHPVNPVAYQMQQRQIFYQTNHQYQQQQHFQRHLNRTSDLRGGSLLSVASSMNRSYNHTVPHYHAQNPSNNVSKNREYTNKAMDDKSSTGIATKHGGDKADRHKRHSYQSNKSNNNTTTQSYKGEKIKKKKKRKKKEESSISMVELNGVNFPALAGTTPKASEHSSFKLSPNIGEETQRTRYAQSVSRRPPPTKKRNSKGSEASKSVSDLTATMETCLAFTEATAASYDGW